jgi:hypothetical protein
MAVQGSFVVADGALQGTGGVDLGLLWSSTPNTVELNGVQVTQFTNPHADRGLPSQPDAPSFLGLQAHTGIVAFRNIQMEAA